MGESVRTRFPAYPACAAEVKFAAAEYAGLSYDTPS
jgi:hypothetical protein